MNETPKPLPKLVIPLHLPAEAAALEAHQGEEDTRREEGTVTVHMIANANARAGGTAETTTAQTVTGIGTVEDRGRPEGTAVEAVVVVEEEGMMSRHCRPFWVGVCVWMLPSALRISRCLVDMEPTFPKFRLSQLLELISKSWMVYST